MSEVRSDRQVFLMKEDIPMQQVETRYFSVFLSQERKRKEVGKHHQEIDREGHKTTHSASLFWLL